MRLHPQAPAGEVFVAPSMDEILGEREQREREAPAAAGTLVEVAMAADRVVGDVPVRVYMPIGARPVTGWPVLVYLHGGGWVFGSIGTADAACRRLADRSSCVVVSVGYRLSPEAVWPAAIDDGEAVLLAIRGREALSDLEIDTSRIIVAGDSVGGFLAQVLARRARDAGRPVAGQALVYPVVRRAALHDRESAAGTDDGLSVDAMQWYWGQFLGDAAHDSDDPDVDPMATEHVGLPPTLVLTAEHDVLRPEGEAYAQALQDAGVDVVATRWLGLPHGFFPQFTTYPAAGHAVDHVAAWCRDVAGS